MIENRSLRDPLILHFMFVKRQPFIISGFLDSGEFSILRDYVPHCMVHASLDPGGTGVDVEDGVAFLSDLMASESEDLLESTKNAILLHNAPVKDLEILARKIDKGWVASNVSTANFLVQKFNVPVFNLKTLEWVGFDSSGLDLEWESHVLEFYEGTELRLKLKEIFHDATLLAMHVIRGSFDGQAMDLMAKYEERGITRKISAIITSVFGIDGEMIGRAVEVDSRRTSLEHATFRGVPTGELAPLATKPASGQGNQGNQDPPLDSMVLDTVEAFLEDPGGAGCRGDGGENVIGDNDDQDLVGLAPVYNGHPSQGGEPSGDLCNLRPRDLDCSGPPFLDENVGGTGVINIDRHVSEYSFIMNNDLFKRAFLRLLENVPGPKTPSPVEKYAALRSEGNWKDGIDLPSLVTWLDGVKVVDGATREEIIQQFTSMLSAFELANSRDVARVAEYRLATRDASRVFPARSSYVPGSSRAGAPSSLESIEGRLSSLKVKYRNLRMELLSRGKCIPPLVYPLAGMDEMIDDIRSRTALVDAFVGSCQVHVARDGPGQSRASRVTGLVPRGGSPWPGR